MTLVHEPILLAEKKWFLIRGSSNSQLEITNGQYMLFNKSFDGKLKLEVNAGDTLILFTEKPTTLTTLSPLQVEEILSNPFPGDWLTLRIDIQPLLKNRIVVIGASDSGKTTLLKFLAFNLPKKNQRIGLIDLDVGQNSLGLPGTINLAEFTFNETKLLYSSYFGHISPAGNSGLFLKVVEEFFEKIQHYHFQWLLIDTSGYLNTTEALTIKNRLLKIIKPQYSILLGNEAQKIERKLPTRTIRYLKISSAIEGIKKEKVPGMRKKKRAERFENYFKGSKSISVPIKNIITIIIYFEKEYRELVVSEEIAYFLQSNTEKLLSLFIELTSVDTEEKTYAKIESINEETIKFCVSKELKAFNRLTIRLGSIMLA